MFPRRLRLARADFPRVYRRARRRRNRSYTLWWLAVNPELPTRFGVVVSKRVAAKAVVRNRYRRQVWAHLYMLRNHLPSAGYLAIIAANPGVPPAPYAVQRRELAELLTVLPHHTAL